MNLCRLLRMQQYKHELLHMGVGGREGKEDRDWGEGRQREGKGERRVEEGEKCNKFIHWLVYDPWPHPPSHNILTSHINTSAQTDHYTTHHAHSYVPHQYILPDNS